MSRKVIRYIKKYETKEEMQKESKRLTRIGIDHETGMTVSCKEDKVAYYYIKAFN